MRIQLLGSLARIREVQIWHTQNASNHSFAHLGPVSVDAATGVVSLSVAPESIYTVTSTVTLLPFSATLLLPHEHTASLSRMVMRRLLLTYNFSNSRELLQFCCAQTCMAKVD